ncbi:MAG: hypothetical protein CW338_04950 [Clostridiales bacterium]|nr:hypothetical protein [Clostridiales bacterium]
MKKQPFIPKEKLSKKKRSELDRQKRVMWAFSPVSRVKKDKTKYDRKKLRRDPDDPGGAFLNRARFLQSAPALFLESEAAP